MTQGVIQRWRQRNDTPAQALFRRYMALEAAFDPALADLYADDALIENLRQMPDGSTRTLRLPAPQYKALLRTALPLAKLRDDRNRYRDLRFTADGDGVRIDVERESLLKRYRSPLRLRVAPDNDGVWRIVEEYSRSRG